MPSLPGTMEDPEPPSVDDGPSLLWQPGRRRSRKSGCSNIFAGVNLRQLRRLFHVAGEGDAEQRARLVWGGGARNRGQREEEEEGEEERDGEEEAHVEAGLAQALVGFRVRARSRTGIRTDGHREPRWLKAFGHLRIKEVSLGHPESDTEGDPGDFGALEPLPGGSEGAEGGVPSVEPQRPCERPVVSPGTSSWRAGGVRQEGTKDPERYLHRILH